MALRVALFGGSFNPIHHGHLIVARTLAEKLALDQVILLPSASPPHKPAAKLASPQHRTAMLQLAIDGEDIFQLNDFDLKRNGPSYTIDTIRHFRALQGEQTELCWIIGADWLDSLGTWHRASELVEECRIVSARRPSSRAPDWSRLAAVFQPHQVEQLRCDVIETPWIDISSTNIRMRVLSGRSIRYLVPESVRLYIEQHRLYRGAS